MAASCTEIEEFLGGPLVSWLSSCLHQPECLQEYSSLFDGQLIFEVILKIDPEPSFHVANLKGLEDNAFILGRIKNFEAIIKNIKSLYEEELGQTLLVSPECICLGNSPESREGLENMKLLLLLLLGAAVQCPNKEIFITRIKELDVDLQHSIVECIKQVTDMQTVVLTPDAIELFKSPIMYSHICRLAKERDQYLTKWANSYINEGICVNDATKSTTTRNSSTLNTSHSNADNNHLAVELADWKARLRKQRQELEEKSEQLSESREELEHTKLVLAKLRADSQDWFSEARKAAAYRDEVDALREKADRADRLELEIQKYRDRLADAEYYKTRVTELQEDIKALMETRDTLEEQLQTARRRADQCLPLEAAIIRLKREANDIALERDADQQKIQELIEENTHLQYITKSVLNESTHGINTDGDFDDSVGSGDNSLSEQLTSNAQARALRLELENKRLMSTIETLKEESLHESSEKFLELEKEKKRLALKCDQLNENCTRLKQQNVELEDVFKNALEENRKLQDSMHSQKFNMDKQIIERESEKIKLLEFEKHLESLNKDKQRIQLLCESVQRRADDLEKSVEMKTKEVNMLKPEADRVTPLIIQSEELKIKVSCLEKENNGFLKEVNKIKESLEEKHVHIDKLTTELEQKNVDLEKLHKDLENMLTQSTRLQEFEKKTQELQSQTQMDYETIKTLQNDLIVEKVNTDKVKVCLDKLGINITDIFGNDITTEDLIEKIFTNTDNINLISEISSRIGLDKRSFFSCTKENVEIDSTLNRQVEQLTLELAALQSAFDGIQAENAKLQVNIATLTSQNGSLASQQMTLQLANSQLAAEKEEIIKEIEVLKNQQDNLLRDQVALQTLHEQLNAEYETLLSEREPLKATVRDLKVENRELKERLATLDIKMIELENDKEHLKVESRNLINLRAEHSKLKEDFRNLYTASEKMKTEYKNMQEEYRNIRTECSQLKLRNTEVSGEINTKIEIINSLEIEVSKTNQNCEMLMQMNKNLDMDRRSLMEHVTQLLTQYHELLMHSMQDKQHYHQEEKMFTDKVNALCRQKEKLEEKIMEHYKKLDNCTQKRRGFGASFVKRVRKAGTDLINRVPSRNNRRSMSIEDSSRLGRSQITLAGSESGESDPGANPELDKSSNADQASLLISSSVASVESPRHSGDSNFTRRLSGSSTHSGGGDDALIRASLRRRPQKTAPSSHRNSFQGFENAETSIMQQSAPNPTSMGFGAAGTRRTVYVADDEAEVSLSTPAHSNTRPQNTPVKENPTYLVYNRISTVIGDGAAQSLNRDIGEELIPEEKVDEGIGSRTDIKRSSGRETANPANKPNAKECAIWYEYGCV